MSPRAGGEADKFGNRYEGAWTVRHLLFVLAGKAESVTVEDFGDLAQGVEFTYRRQDAIEVHQLKRQDSKANSWTVKSLQDKGIWKNAQHHVDAGRDFHFVSILPAVALQSLADRARRSDSTGSFVRDWLTNRELRDAFTDLCSPGIFGSQDVSWKVLRGFWIDWPSERDVVQTNATLAELQLEGATGVLAAAGLGDLVANNLGVRLDATKIEAELGKYGLRRTEVRRVTSIANQARSLTENWAAGVEREFLQPAIERSEAQQLADSLDGTDSLLLLTGKAGGGKTAVLHQVLRTLQTTDTSVLCFRIDRLDPFATTTELGSRIGLDVSPVTALAAIAGNLPCVLVVDQLDAVSLASGRTPRSFDAVASLVREASAFPNMKVLLACRKFDVENDYRIRELLNDKHCKRIEVADLSDTQVEEAVGAIGLDVSALSAHQRNLLRSPLNLVLLSSVADDAEAPSFQTTNHLFDAFWRRKLTDCVQRRESVRFNEVISTLAEAISARQHLSVPATVLDNGNLSVDADVLVSEHVLVRDGQQIAFFHEAFFDYAFARGWIERNQTLVEFLTDGEQELFRRAQVRQIMNLLRDLEPGRFAGEVEGLLLSPDVRYHIKDVAIALLGGLPNPTTREWGMIAAVLEEHPAFENQLWRTLRGVEWFERLDAEGLIEDWLAGDDATEQSRALDVMVGVAKHDPDRLAQILQPHTDRAAYPSWLRWVVRFANVYESRPIFELLLEAVRSGAYESAEHELWLSTHDLGKHQPAWAVELLAAYLVDRPGAMSLDADGKVAALLDRDHSVISLAQQGAHGAPETFCETIIPYMLRVMAATPLESKHNRPLRDRHFSWRYPNNTPHELEDALLDGAASAIRLHVEHDLTAARAILGILAADPHDSAQWLLYQGLQSAGEPLAQWAADIMLEGPQRFMSGYIENSVWAARQVIHATSRFITEESFQQVEAAILALRFPWEKQRPGWYMFNLLSAMDEGRLSEVGRRRLGELRRMTGMEQPPEPEGVTGGFVGPPISRDAAQKMNDDQWLGAIAKHNAERTDWRTFTGGAQEQSHVLKDEAIGDLGRFTRLALRFSESTNPAYSGAILLALADADPLADPAPVFDAVRHIASLGQAANDRWLGWALRKYLKVVPQDLVEMVVDRAVNAADPVDGSLSVSRSNREFAGGEDLYTSGMNSARGSSAEILGDLLVYDVDGSRAALIVPVLDRMAADPSTAVRSCVAHVLHVAMRHDRPRALRAFSQLVDADDMLLATHTVGRLIAYLGYENPDLAKPVIERMVRSSVFETREVGGQLAALAAMQWEMPDLLDFVLASDDLALRKGAAGACAHRLANTSDTVVARRGLEQFMQDGQGEVRKAAAEVAGALRGQRLRPYRDALRSLISSAAFSDALAQLLITLDRAPDRVDDLVLQCSRRFVEVFGVDSGDIRTGAAGDARHVGELLIRAYAQATSRNSRSAVLDLLDRMLEIGAYGIADIVRESER
ncbi:hypothetical protein [Microbispora siamensis]|uniref:ATP-binding protein n=1 Tax=Microbispora siamensis TaxID=564413 RepID=A0ABQ4GN58_9ACTN|nr:hypothetical protein [Microbispora siamensis]GIH62861.1 hypothetical protein Msi02_36780 [Microbispora siamensis]